MKTMMIRMGKSKLVDVTLPDGKTVDAETLQSLEKVGFKRDHMIPEFPICPHCGKEIGFNFADSELLAHKAEMQYKAEGVWSVYDLHFTQLDFTCPHCHEKCYAEIIIENDDENDRFCWSWSESFKTPKELNEWTCQNFGDAHLQYPDNRHVSEIGNPLFKRVGRNDPCPCGSGKKYKKCCLDKVTT